MHFVYSEEKENFGFYKNDSLLMEFPVKKYLEQFGKIPQQQYSSGYYKYIDAEKLVMEERVENCFVKIFITSLDGKEEDGKIKLTQLNGTMLLKMN